MAKYQRFNPDLWTIVFNYEAIAVVTTIAENALKVTGHFRTEADYIGLNFTTKDFWNHRYVRYENKDDYSGTVLSFVPKYTGEISKFNNRKQQPALIIDKKDESQYYISLGMQGVKNKGSSSFLFNSEIKLPNEWIAVGSESLTWTDPANPNVVVKGAKIEKDYDMDYVNGRFFTTENGIIPYNASVSISYVYNTHERYTIDFDNVYEGTHTSVRKKIYPTTITRVAFPVIPSYFKEGDRVMTGRSDTFELSITEIKVTGGDLNTIPKAKEKNPYRLAEGFDDEYNKNPKRIIDSMHLLGYEGVINYYIGASHFYDKKGTEGKISHDERSMILDKDKSINNAFIAWTNSFMDNMKKKDFDSIIISVAMENLQLPEDWKQRLWDGTAGASGWQPPTNFYSPTNPDVKTFIEKITRATLDLVVAKGLQPILQLGESWFWWQEFAPGDVNAPYEGRPPAFYDRTTKERFKKEMGYDLPIYKSSDVQTTNATLEVSYKLRQYLGEFTVFMNKIIKTYENSEFTILFFPPSVMDVVRTPEILRIVNAPFEYWKNPILDYIQIEDYDWVTREQPEHEDVYTHAWYEMGYPFNKQHYFAGFVLLPEDAYKEWKLIERAAQEALGKGFLEVFIWAGTQIRRDSWTPRLNTYVADSEEWKRVDMKQDDR